MPVSLSNMVSWPSILEQFVADTSALRQILTAAREEECHCYDLSPCCSLFNYLVQVVCY